MSGPLKSLLRSDVRTYVHTWAVSSEELAECLASEEPTEGEGVGVTVRAGRRNLCHAYCIIHDIHSYSRTFTLARLS